MLANMVSGTQIEGDFLEHEAPPRKERLQIFGDQRCRGASRVHLGEEEMNYEDGFRDDPRFDCHLVNPLE